MIEQAFEVTLLSFPEHPGREALAETPSHPFRTVRSRDRGRVPALSHTRQTARQAQGDGEMAADREKALDLALASIDKQFGKGSIMKMGE